MRTLLKRALMRLWCWRVISDKEHTALLRFFNLKDA